MGAISQASASCVVQVQRGIVLVFSYCKACPLYSSFVPSRVDHNGWPACTSRTKIRPPIATHLPILPSHHHLHRREIIRPALFLGPEFRIVRIGMVLQLDLVRVHNLLATILTLRRHEYGKGVELSRKKGRNEHEENAGDLTMDVGLGAFTGRPFGLTGARVPAASAFLCSR